MTIFTPSLLPPYIRCTLNERDFSILKRQPQSDRGPAWTSFNWARRWRFASRNRDIFTLLVPNSSFRQMFAFPTVPVDHIAFSMQRAKETKMLLITVLREDTGVFLLYLDNCVTGDLFTGLCWRAGREREGYDLKISNGLQVNWLKMDWQHRPQIDRERETERKRKQYFLINYENFLIFPSLFYKANNSMLLELREFLPSIKTYPQRIFARNLRMEWNVIWTGKYTTK